MIQLLFEEPFRGRLGLRSRPGLRLVCAGEKGEEHLVSQPHRADGLLYQLFKDHDTGCCQVLALFQESLAALEQIFSWGRREAEISTALREYEVKKCLSIPYLQPVQQPHSAPRVGQPREQ